VSDGAGELEISYSPGLEGWLSEQNVSLAFAVPPSKLFLIGLRDDGRLSAFERTFNKCMGLAAAGAGTIYPRRHRRRDLDSGSRHDQRLRADERDLPARIQQKIKNITRATERILASYRSITRSTDKILAGIKTSSASPRAEKLLSQAAKLAREARADVRKVRKEKPSRQALKTIAAARRKAAIARRLAAKARIIAARARAANA